MSSESRNLILNRVLAAVPREQSEAATQVPRNYIRRGSLDPKARIELMIERLREYDAEVVECISKNLVSCIKDQLKARERTKIVVSVGLPSDWASIGGVEWKLDRKLEFDEIEKCDGVLTTASAGIADSGTIVLHHTGSEGRRVLSLLPDWHLCILRANQIVETLPEYFECCTKPPGLATYISGPSATADIEMTRVKGVHGPRFLNVIIVHENPDGEPDAPPRPPKAPEPEFYPPRPHRPHR
jgi:L-lactate dehydrogenase complex protein LldG